jgi:pantoate--beta-alanine ligase
VVSIFVNPTQFGEGEDYDEYPRRIRDDSHQLASEGADMVFSPAASEMYPDGYCTYVTQEGLTDKLCGRYRAGHFRGVCTIVTKLLNVIPAHRVYFGRKDFQQSVVIRRMVRDLNIPVEVRVLPTVRESDGLALSSRNEYLNPEERKQAVCLHRALQEARKLFASGEESRESIVNAMIKVLGEYPLVNPQYVDVVDAGTLESSEKVTAGSVAVLAVYLGVTRLIDNMPLGDVQDIYLA